MAVLTMVFEKHNVRAGNCCALGVTLDNLAGAACARRGALSLLDGGAADC